MAFMPVKLTMRPQPLPCMPGRQRRQSRIEASRSTDITRCHSVSLISRKALPGRTAALLTSASMLPKRARASPAIRLQSSALPTSPMTISVSAPSLLASCATFSQAARSLEPLRATLKPSSARPSTTARPMLRPPPVIKAVLRDAIIPLLAVAGQHVALLGEHRLHPVDGRAHARRAAQVAVHDDPVVGGDLRDGRRQPLEQGMAVADIARQHAAAGAGTNRLQMHEHRRGAQRHGTLRFFNLSLDPARRLVVRLLLGIGHPRIGVLAAALVDRAGKGTELAE